MSNGYGLVYSKNHQRIACIENVDGMSNGNDMMVEFKVFAYMGRDYLE
jgi:hypothetical protein